MYGSTTARKLHNLLKRFLEEIKSNEGQLKNKISIEKRKRVNTKKSFYYSMINEMV